MVGPAMPELEGWWEYPQARGPQNAIVLTQLVSVFYSKCFSQVVICLCFDFRALNWLFLTILPNFIVVFSLGEDLLNFLFYYSQKSCPDRYSLTKEKRGRRRQRPSIMKALGTIFPGLFKPSNQQIQGVLTTKHLWIESGFFFCVFFSN